MDTRSVETSIVRGQNMQLCHSLGCKLMADNTERLSMSFLKTFKVESGHFDSCVSVLEICSNLPSSFAHTYVDKR